MAVHGCIWLYVAVYGCIWRFIAAVWLSIAAYGCMYLCMAAFGARSVRTVASLLVLNWFLPFHVFSCHVFLFPAGSSHPPAVPATDRNSCYFLQFPAIPVVSPYPTFAYHSCNVLAFPVSSCNFVLFPEISCPILLLKCTHFFSSKNHVQIFAPNNLTGASSDHAFAN